MKLAHLADLHLGFRQLERQTPRGGNQREADVAEAFQRAVDDIVEQRPDLIIIAGDVFHSVRPTNPAILFLFKKLAELRAGLPESRIVLVAGNHDTPRPSDTGSSGCRCAARAKNTSMPPTAAAVSAITTVVEFENRPNAMPVLCT